MFKTIRAARFLVIGPIILVFLVIVNVLASPGTWWVKWAALGIGFIWILSLIRVIGAMIVLGGLAALIAHLRRK